MRERGDNRGTQTSRADANASLSLLSTAVLSHSPEETEAWGRRFGEAVKRIDQPLTIELRGLLGAGKTAWVRGFVPGHGNRQPVRSPTFSLIRIHPGLRPIYHLDAYRLEDPEELLLQGWDDWLRSSVVLVEWGERIRELLPRDRLQVELTPFRFGVESSDASAPITLESRWISTAARGELSRRILAEFLR